MSGHAPCILPEHLQCINTPLQVEAWQQYLSKHPDLAYVDYILSGIKLGFRIGFNDLLVGPLSQPKRNMQSAYDNADFVQKQLAKDCNQGFMLGPLLPADFPYVHSSRIGVIPKKYQSGKWRLIVDLSYPPGKSVNDGIDKQHCSLTYVKVDNIVDSILQLGRGTLLAKLDVQSAFRIVPVHPADRHLLGIRWGDSLYLDATLPFGLRSAPKIFNALADALEWIVRQQGICYVWHYLDDFLVAGRPGSGECMNSLQTILKICSILGIPLAKEKLAGPALNLAILGIEFDTVQLVLRLPPEKLSRITALLSEWAHKKRCTRRELQSLVGQLQHVSTIVKPGRTFLRRMYDMLGLAKQPHHHIYLNSEFKSDLAWWMFFLQYWDGTAMMSTSQPPRPSVVVTSDASGSWGCGAFCGNKWFQLAWPDDLTKQQPIALKELAPIVVAVALWGAAWKQQTVLCRTDNSAVVSMLRTRTSKTKAIMHLIRCLHFFEAHFECHIVSVHIPGIHNERADDLSRNHLYSFMQKMPEADRTPTVIPSALLNLLFILKPDWLSVEWKRLFKATLGRL